MTSHPLSGIARPEIADIGGAFRTGQERGRANVSRKMVADIIGQTFGGKLGALAQRSPDTALKLAQALSVPANEKERLDATIGDIQAAATIAAAGDRPGAIAYLKEVRDRKNQLGIETSQMDAQIGLLESDPDSGFQGLQALSDQFIALKAIQDPAKFQKGTASQKDFATLQSLKRKAKATGDPEDIRKAEQFERQTRFAQISPQAQADIDIGKASEIETIKAQKALETTAGKAAIKKSSDMFDQIGQIRLSNLNVDEAIRLLEVEGAPSGPIINQFPSLRASALKLDNVRRKIGLDVIGSVTFGALSKGELDLAMQVAIPNLPSDELIVWLKRRKAAQEKLMGYYEEAATFLGTPGNTIPKFLEQQKARKQIRDATPNEKTVVRDARLKALSDEELDQALRNVRGENLAPGEIIMIDANGNRGVVKDGRVVRELPRGP